MQIIFEGPDGCGKTTLAELVSKKIGFPIYRQSRPCLASSDLWHDMYKDRQLNFIALKKIVPLNVVLDRWHISEMVYSQFSNTMRDGSRVVEPVFDAEVAEAYFDCILVNVRCGYKTVCERVAKRDGKPYEFTEEEFNFIKDEFTTAADTLPFVKMIHVFTDSEATSEEISDLIASVVRQTRGQ